MIEVTISEDDQKVIIKISGHSGQGKKGEDLVCAGISGVVQFLIIHFFNNSKRNGKFNLSAGEGFIEFTKKDGDSEIISSFIEYLKIVEKSYPNTLTLRLLRK